MATEIMNSNSALASIPTQSLAEFQREVYTSKVSRLTMRARNDGKTDTPLHIGHQIKTDDVIGHILTIVHVGYGYAPMTDNKGNPIFEENPDENGVAVQKMSRFPVIHFAEAPGWWYNGGAIFDGILDSWIAEVGDDKNNDILPLVNTELEVCGGVKAYFDWKDKRDASGQKYVNIILG